MDVLLHWCIIAFPFFIPFIARQVHALLQDGDTTIESTLYAVFSPLTSCCKHFPKSNKNSSDTPWLMVA